MPISRNDAMALDSGRSENILTVITYDNGGEWKALTAPAVSGERRAPSLTECELSVARPCIDVSDWRAVQLSGNASARAILSVCVCVFSDFAKRQLVPRAFARRSQASNSRRSSSGGGDGGGAAACLTSAPHSITHDRCTARFTPSATRLE